jgi:ATP-dependent RNA helicase DDX19/DBP5
MERRRMLELVDDDDRREDDDEDEEDTDAAVAQRLREKIRLRAASLLDRVDASISERKETSRSSSCNSANASAASPNQNILNTTKHKESPTFTFATSGTDGSMTPLSTSSSSLLQAVAGTSMTTLPAASTTISPGGGGGGGDGNAKNTTKSHLELTKRLQKLALERQQRSVADRLRILEGGEEVGENATECHHLRSVYTFPELDLPEHLLQAVYAMGMDHPSAIQAAALPRIFAGRNLIAQAPSGSGKTAAFCLGILHRIQVTESTTQALCVTPTRELAVQIVQDAIRPLSQYMQPIPLRVQLAISQIETIPNKQHAPPHVIVGTPGKIVDWFKRKIINPKHVRMWVLDEADQMVEAQGGHRANSVLIQKQLPKRVQCLFFSATFSPSVLSFATKIMSHTTVDRILLDSPSRLVLSEIRQLYVDLRTGNSETCTAAASSTKLEFLADIYSLLTIGQSIVFVATKKEADAVHRVLTSAGYACSVLHGSVDPSTRDATMQEFRNGTSNVLITTNLLARGVDVDTVCLVVNYNVPTLGGSSSHGGSSNPLYPETSSSPQPDYETYLHRIGRTGRFGRKGTAITLIADDESLALLLQIERHFQQNNSDYDNNRSKTTMIERVPADPEALAEMIEI